MFLGFVSNPAVGAGAEGTVGITDEQLGHELGAAETGCCLQGGPSDSLFTWVHIYIFQ